MSEATQYPSALPISLLLALHGFRKGSLSPTGAVAAFAAGYGHIANPLKVFGVTLIAFYFLGSRATKVKIEQKAKLEDGPDPSKPGGNRNAVQVLSSCLPSLLAALYYRYGVPALDSATCPSTSIIHKQLIYVALGQLSTAFADTLASELGILSPSAPVYLLTLRPVPPGTNGGVSLYGLIASIVGGLVIGGVMVTDLLVERAGCRADSGFAVDLIIFGVLSGFLGSLLDSLLGAVAQQTLYSTKDKKILTDHSTRSSKEPGLQKIGVGRDILSNSAVNFASGSAMAAFGWWWASR